MLNMRHIYLFIFLSLPISSLSQKISIISEKQLDNFYCQTVSDVKVQNEFIYILGNVRDSSFRTVNYLMTQLDFNGNIIKQAPIKSKPGYYYSKIAIGEKNILIMGDRQLEGEDEGVVNRIALLNSDFKIVWEKELAEKWEGGLLSIYTYDHFLIATNNNSSCLLYLIDKKGNVLKKKEIINGAPLVDGLYQLNTGDFLISAWTYSKDNSYGDCELILISKDFDLIDEFKIPINRIDGYKNDSAPEHKKMISNDMLVLLWTGNPPMTMIVNPQNKSIKEIEHIRYDVYLYDVTEYNNESLVYSGKLGNKAAIYLINNSEILSKITFGEMGDYNWNNYIFRVSDTDFVMITDKIRTNAFESNIQFVKVKIE
jgi:hypothetical protein